MLLYKCSYRHAELNSM